MGHRNWETGAHPKIHCQKELLALQGTCRHNTITSQINKQASANGSSDPTNSSRLVEKKHCEQHEEDDDGGGGGGRQSREEEELNFLIDEFFRSVFSS